jgi:hypothetical protein
MANFGGGVAGGLGGAATGAGIGSLFGPGPGTAIGAGVGGLAGFLGGLFGGGKEGGVQQAQNFTPEQQNILKLLLGQGQQGLQNPYQGFEGIENYANKQFQQNTIPSLAERFTSLGSNSLSSPAFASQLGAAGSDLATGLGFLRSQYGQQNQQNALAQLALGLSPQFENFYSGRQPGFGEELFKSSAQAAPALYQSYLMNKALQGIK